MSQELAVRTKEIEISPAQYELAKRTLAPTATADEFELFVYECRRRGVHPLDRQIHFSKHNSKDGPKVTMIVGVDYHRSKAAYEPDFDGTEGPTFEYAEGDTEKKRPILARVKVFRKGKAYPFVAEARWDEYLPGENKAFMWNKMPHTMLGKCAEALAFRKAYPEMLSGLYTEEEMAQAGDYIEAEVIDKGASVRPAGAAAPTQPAEKKEAPKAQTAASKSDESIDDLRAKLTKEISDYCNAHKTRFNEVLKAASSFTKDGKENFIQDVAKCASSKWLQSTLGKLRKMAEEKGKVAPAPAATQGAPTSDPEGCNWTPDGCTHVQYHDEGGNLVPHCAAPGCTGVCKYKEAR